jgi:hypothetical protein
MRERHEHQRTDDDGFHRHYRNGLTKWVVATFMAGLVSGFGLLLVWDRGRIAGDARDALKRTQSLEMAHAVMVERFSAFENRMIRLEAGQAEILEAVR